MFRPVARILCGVTLATALVLPATTAEAAPGAATGPSSSQSPYVVGSQPGVVTKSILTVGDAVGDDYRMVGIPDGLGAFDNGDGTFTVLMNHELGGTARAVTRRQGRLCIQMEEVAGGRAFAHLLNGASYELAGMEKASWENILANPRTGDKTVVAGFDDTTPGQVYLYAGDKKSDGSPVDRAGLTGGDLYGVQVSGIPSEDATAGIPSGTRFTPHNFGDASVKSVTEIEEEGNTAGVTDFLRPEDGAWDPERPSDLYFNTTASFGGKSRLWRLRFDDPSNPAGGGVIDMLLEGDENGGTSDRFHMLDNMTINGRGQLVLQEDPGNQTYLARIWQYDIASDKLTEVAKHDPDRFGENASALLTTDEESSGVIDVSAILGSGWYLLDVQAHYNPNDSELVEGGQLLAMHIPPSKFK